MNNDYPKLNMTYKDWMIPFVDLIMTIRDCIEIAERLNRDSLDTK